MEFALAMFAIAAALKIVEITVRALVFWLAPKDTRIPVPVKAGWEQDEPWPECFDSMEDL